MKSEVQDKVGRAATLRLAAMKMRHGTARLDGISSADPVMVKTGTVDGGFALPLRPKSHKEDLKISGPLRRRLAIGARTRTTKRRLTKIQVEDS